MEFKLVFTRVISSLSVSTIVLVSFLAGFSKVHAQATQKTMSEKTQEKSQDEQQTTATNTVAILPQNYFNQLSNEDIGKYLGWHNDLNDRHNICGGYYLEPAFSYYFKPNVSTDSQQNPQVIDEAPIHLSAKEGDLALKGESVLTGDVKITQVDRELTADSASVYRNDQGEVKQINLSGKVHLRQPQKLVIASSAQVPLEDGKVRDLTLHDIVYRVSLNAVKSDDDNFDFITEHNNADDENSEDNATNTDSPAIELSGSGKRIDEDQKITALTAWGKAETVEEVTPEKLAFSDATYSTCPPNDKTCFWHLSAYKLYLNKESGRGHSYATTLWVKHMPVMFFPYFSFPIDARRKSGFLYPTFSESSENGFSLALPYYANLAPNYDVTLVPTYYDQRGFYLDSEWRYLMPNSSGFINAGIAPHDRKFADFQKSAETDYASSPSLDDLENSSTTRTSFRWKDATNFNSQWSAHIDYNYVSDDYYTEDFNQSFEGASGYQLLQQGKLNYYGTHWSFYGLLKNYQTLHPVDQDTINNQYARLPELNLDGDFPDQLSDTDLTWKSQYDYFYSEADPGVSTDPETGSRVNLQPGVSMPFRQSYGYITPTVELSTTAYQLENQASGDPNNPSRVLPLLDIDSGLYFDRPTTLFNRQYNQTFEPRLYYLYVPYTNQDDLPDFDSILNTLNYEQLFQNNRFSSVDRIGDANQFSLGLTSRFFAQDSGNEKLSISVGDIWYLADRKVTLCSDNSSDCEEQNTEEFSPVVSTINYHLNTHWSVNTDTSYDFGEKNMDNSAVTIGYVHDARRVINFGYAYSSQGNVYTDNTSDSDLYNLSQLHASYAWPVSQQWNTLGSLDISPSYGNGMSYMFGAEYNSCCWGIRFLINRELTGVENGDNQYDQTYYIQFVLKGMGSLNNNNAQGIIQDNIDNYNDDFVRVF